jgi:hypothetical protein
MIPGEILQSVCLIRPTRNTTASCFLITISHKAVFVTAKHLFPNGINNSNISFDLYRNDGWQNCPGQLYLHSNKSVDVAIITTDLPRVENPYDVEDSKYFVSQDCYFLGFPYGMKLDDNKPKEQQINSGFPIPFVKKAIISSFLTDANNVRNIYLDGHNNPGFSGGPVVVKNLRSTKFKMRIIGVISGYRNHINEITTPLGKIQTTENSGIVVSHSIKHVYEILQGNNLPY